MRIDVLTLFPGAFTGPLDVSILGRARESGLLSVELHNIRDHATDRHKSVDDYPFGGGPGMVLRVDVLDRALDHVAAEDAGPVHTIYLSPAGERLNDRLVRQLAKYPRLVLICGRYEGIDHRIVEHRVDREVSLGDFIVTGGELPAMVLIDAVARHIPGALGDEQSAETESFSDGLLEHPQYTRPAEYRGWRVPEVLTGGDHAAIERWQREQRLERTRRQRPDLLPPLTAGPQGEVGRIPGVARIRHIRWPDDYPALRELWDSAAAPPVFHEPADVARLLERNPGLAFIAETGKARPRILGVVIGAFDGYRGTAYNLAVATGAASSGIESALLVTLRNELRALGCSSFDIPRVIPG